MTDLQQQIYQAAKNRLAGYPAAPNKALPGDRRSEHSLRLAAEALAAYQEGDWHRYYAAGHDLLSYSAQSSRRAGWRAQPDQLDRWVSAYMEEHPQATSSQVVAAALRSAGAGHPVFCDYDEAAGTLEYQPSADSADLNEITLPALRRRVQRHIARQQPVAVA